MIRYSSVLSLWIIMVSCQPATNKTTAETDSSMVQLIALDPGHFHAALVQKNMYPQIDSVVHVYAPGGAELQSYLDLIKQYNERKDNPAHWKEETYTGADYLDKMIADKAGNVVVIAGNNRMKTNYISKAVNAGLNVLADKPMVTDTKDFDELVNAFSTAKERSVLLYDIMTERSEITNILQKELMHMPELFGELQKGTLDDPAVKMESVHFFYKYVSGNILTRPSWFFDPAQQGDAITDVGTHLIDLVQWECFPGAVLDYKKDIQILNVHTWPTDVTLSQFASITKENAFPSFLQQYVKDDSVLQTHANGEVNYTLKGIHIHIEPRWEYKASEGGDTHYSLFKGTLASLEIKQGREENYKPTLYILPVTKDENAFQDIVQKSIEKINATYPGVTIEKSDKGWKLLVPEKYKVGHEAHFSQVMERYLDYLKNKQLPVWEVPGMIAKYYTSTKALEMANSIKR